MISPLMMMAFLIGDALVYFRHRGGCFFPAATIAFAR